ncbi:hypothetical protein EFO88_12700 [Lactiplantibacillus plantarum]|uniref:hypothetical protein n=1 Tax=Lactiplantibacillus plantarum TaxID=1590 RepID=UPI0021A37B63|nr:hypothetical protein [Lactiplantibacillus plantarum]MCT3250897.1 hypothetical protein [Lactiplantibacillus plantarum]
MTQIDHGSANWDVALNNELEELDAATTDTGWVPLTLINGFTNQTDQNKTMVRKVGNITFLKISMTGITANTVCATLPDPFKAGAVGQFLVRTNGGNPFGITIGTDRSILVESSATHPTVATSDYLNGLLIWVA